MTSQIFNSAIHDSATGAIDWDTDAFKIALFAAGYTPDIDAHTKRSDLTNEVSGTGYSAGGKAIAATVAKDNANDRTTVTFAVTQWPTSTLSGVRQAVIYQDTGNASTDRLVCVVDNGSDLSTQSGTLTVQQSEIRFTNAGAV